MYEMTGLSRRFVRAEGCGLWDDKGYLYLDFISANGSLNLGHNHPQIVAGIADGIRQQLPQIYEHGTSPFMGDLAAKLTSLEGEPFEIVFFSNSGTEAVEGAVKIARAATKRSKVVYCHGAFHGTTHGSRSMMASGRGRGAF